MASVNRTTTPNTACQLLECLVCDQPAQDKSHYIIHNASLTDKSIELLGSPINFRTRDAVSVHEDCLNSSIMLGISPELNTIQAMNLTVIYHTAGN